MRGAEPAFTFFQLIMQPARSEPLSEPIPPSRGPGLDVGCVLDVWEEVSVIGSVLECTTATWLTCRGRAGRRAARRRRRRARRRVSCIRRARRGRTRRLRGVEARGARAAEEHRAPARAHERRDRHAQLALGHGSSTAPASARPVGAASIPVGAASSARHSWARAQCGRGFGLWGRVGSTQCAGG